MLAAEPKEVFVPVVECFDHGRIDGSLYLLSTFELFVRDQPDEAIRYAEQAVEVDPNNSERPLGLGRLLHLAGRHEEAIEALSECFALAPTRASCPRELIQPEFALGNRDAALEALTLLEQIAALDSPNSTAWLAYGYGLVGQRDDARRVFEALEAVAASIDYVDPVLWAMAYMGVGEYDEALNRLKLAIENPASVRRTTYALNIMKNLWSDPILEEPEWVEIRNKMRPM